jgi:phage terminase large subunit-like protein
MHLYTACTGTEVADLGRRRELVARRPAWGGLDLASELDLTAWRLVVPDGIDGHVSALWQFWLPEAGADFLDEHTDHRVSQWVEQGWITTTPGEIIDYEVIEADIAALPVADINYREWNGEPIRQRLERVTQVDRYPVPQTFRGMTTA